MPARSGVLYGESGTYKTSQAGRLARYIYKKYGKRTRLISLDGGGWAPLEPEIRAGLIVPYRPPALKNSLAVIRKFMDGQWPKVLKVADPFAPVGTRFNYSTKLFPTSQDEWGEIGAVVVEGWTSVSKVFMADCVIHQRVIGRDPIGSWTQTAPEFGIDVADAEGFCAPSQGHYGFVQNEMWRLVQAFLSQPVEYVLFTALEKRGEDVDTRETVVGPAIEGRQATGQSPAWVGDCLHLDNSTTPGVKQVRAWFTRHVDPVLNLPYPCKARLAPALVPGLTKCWPDGYFPLEREGTGLDTYLELLDELNARGDVDVTKWMAETDKNRATATPATTVL